MSRPSRVAPARVGRRRSAYGELMQACARLTAEDRDAVLDVFAAATAADGVAPVSEQVRLDVSNDGAGDACHLLLRDEAGAVLGYAHLDADASPAPVAEFVVRPDRRGSGHGRALVARLAALAPGRLNVWAHGDLPAARALAAATGFTVVRELRQLSRPLLDAAGRGLDLPAIELPPDVRLRAFRPGQDERAWIALNARAFAHHPEQGRWTEANLRQRMAEPWFDPAGFFLAERVTDDAASLVGFHWTKIVPAEEAEPPLVGEVYVVGVDPNAQGGGLGRALTLAGLRHMRDRGVPTATLYVDGDNTAAIKVYTRLGFTLAAVDVMYGR